MTPPERSQQASGRLEKQEIAFGENDENSIHVWNDGEIGIVLRDPAQDVVPLEQVEQVFEAWKAYGYGDCVLGEPFVVRGAPDHCCMCEARGDGYCPCGRKVR